jgi:translation initiation factor 1
MSVIINIQQQEDPFAQESQHFVHIRLQQHNGRRHVTTIQGLEIEEIETIRTPLKKTLCCSGTIINDPEKGYILQLSGDQRKPVFEHLTKIRGHDKECVKIHGY